MMQSKLKACMLLAAASTVALGLASCNKQGAEVPEPLKVVERATLQVNVGDRSAATKATFSENTLKWAEGDKIVMVSNDCINGTLICTEVDGSGNGTFEGEITQFTPASVEFYFLGNKVPAGVNASFDLSAQSGTESGLVDFLFLKTASPLSLQVKAGTEYPEEVYELSSSLSFNSTPLIPIIEIKNLDQALVAAGMVSDVTGIKATSVKIVGLQNKLRLDLTSGEVSAAMMDNTNITTIAPALSADRANNYFVAVVPQNATDLSMQITYTGSDVNTLNLKGITWTMKNDDGSVKDTNFISDMSNRADVSYGSLSAKAGYSAQTISGGERADGLNAKSGYGGNTADGEDDYLSPKYGYGGNEVN